MRSRERWEEQTISVALPAEGFRSGDDVEGDLVRVFVVGGEGCFVAPGSCYVAGSISAAAKEEEGKASPLDEGNALAVCFDVDVELS